MERRHIPLARSTQGNSISSAPVKWNTGAICTAGEGRAHSLQREQHACSERRAGSQGPDLGKKHILITMVRWGTVTQQGVLVQVTHRWSSQPTHPCRMNHARAC